MVNLSKSEGQNVEVLREPQPLVNVTLSQVILSRIGGWKCIRDLRKNLTTKGFVIV